MNLPPDLLSPAAFYALLAPQRLWFDPQYVGLDTVDPAQPAMYVANHTVYGLMDAPLLMAELYARQGVLLRALADHAHFTVPLWRTLLQRGGAVRGTVEHCAALMQDQQHILVFPGGAREVAKRRGESYQLLWKNRTGFVRLAIQHGYPLRPISALGGDDALSIRMDADDIMATTAGAIIRDNPWLQKLTRGGEMLFPLVEGIAGTPVPRPETFWFKIGEPIPTDGFDADDEADRLALRQQVAQAIEQGLEELRALQLERTPREPTWRRLLRGG
jgi:1-acyl-sn-glycerol-3-phosphate acyltransferase